MTAISLHTRDTAHWRALVTAAQASVESCLDDELESYLVILLLRFAASEREQDRSEQEIRASARNEPVNEAADRCLMIAGFMPDQARDFGMSIHQVVEMGRNGYEEAARRTRNPLYERLADQFVVLMDLLQIMRTLDSDELRVDLFRVYDQWQETGSRYAYRLLQAATRALPVTATSRYRH